MPQESRFIAKPLSKKKLRAEASQIRMEYGVGLDEPFPICEYLEIHLALLDDEYSFEVEEVSAMPDKYAETFPDQKKIVVRQDVYYGAHKGNRRDRFTLAHELGHYMLHHGQQLSLARNGENVENLPPYYSPEWQANTFAAQLLCPIEGAELLSFKEIVHKYGVSYDVAYIQSNK